MDNNEYIDRFYKTVLNGKKGNLFTRVDALEELLKNLQVRDVNQYITQIAQQNREIIIPSLLGGETDPTAATFSGIVISPSGQLIGGVLYSFAIVENGVVVSGVGDNGVTVIINNPAPSYATNWQNSFIFDEFPSTIFYSVSTEMVGQLAWTSTPDTSIGATGLSGTSDSEHYGVATVRNATNTDGYIVLNAILSPMVKLVQFVVLADAMIDAGDGCIFGLVDLSGTLEIDGSLKGIYFRREYTETNWQTVTRNGGGVTTNDTGVAFTADTWYLFEIKQDVAGTIKFYINQTLVETHTTNIDTATSLYPTFGMKDPGSTSAFGVTIDYFAMQLTPITQRWD